MRPLRRPLSNRHASVPAISTSSAAIAAAAGAVSPEGYSPAPQSTENPFDFEFRNPFNSKRFHIPGYRKSLDSRNTSSIIPGSVAPTSISLTEDENARMIYLKSFFNKIFKRGKNGRRGKGADQAGLDAEEYQLWNKLTPLLFQPSAIFMGLKFMIDDKGSNYHDRSTVDWNMNIILALVKVVVLPYTFTSKDTKIKNRDRRNSMVPKRNLTEKERAEKEAKEQKRFLIIRVQYGDNLPSWLIERSIDDFVHLYESYHPPIPEVSLLFKSIKVPKPPACIRSRFGLSARTMSMSAGVLDPTDDLDGNTGGDGNDTSYEHSNTADVPHPPANGAGVFESKAAPKLARELQTFLLEMIRYAMYMPDAERMCKFLELSALTFTNVPDGGYQGKEGYLTVVKQKRLMDEGPLTNAVKKMYRKPVSKYFIVRDSFIIVAASHKNTEIQDVILLDSSFRANKCPRHIHAPHSFDIINAELKFHVRAKSDHRRRQFVESIRKMPSLWKESKRFNSFAPVRRDVRRKAKEGVKVYIVMYSEVDAAMHLASLRAKRLLRKLCPENIWVQRHGPNLKTAWWAHHEKLVVIDNIITFLGGLDLCFGRWDTAEHTLIDLKDASDQGPRWPGQDYSNPRIKDFCDLSKPEMDSIERSENPRMPWHDVGLQILGQPARDVARHFIQRWNFLCRTKPKQRRIPFLLPKPDISISKLEEMGLMGTCEVQILRSVSSWSIGSKDPECSILTAYLAAIERAENFIYIENQFFITSTNVNKTIVHNGIGRALTDRIIKAHRENEKFRVIVVLPLVPGFEGGINTPAATSVRMVMLSIYESICHGKNSIYGRLATAGIHKPYKYISFYGLRNWAKFGEKFITEQVYIHAKMMIVDDRVAIIGSANINERSMLGNRDSEIAAVVRDQDYIDSTMNGVPYKVSRFAHTLRMNLMMEHLGLSPMGHSKHHHSPSYTGSTDSQANRHGSHRQSPSQCCSVAECDGPAPPFNELDFVDPVHPAFYEDIWKHYANANTLIFREKFKCIPDNTVRNWADYKEFNKQSNVDDPRMKEEERTLKDKAFDRLLGPTVMGEHFRTDGNDSGEEEEEDGEGEATHRRGRRIDRSNLKQKYLERDQHGNPTGQTNNEKTMGLTGKQTHREDQRHRAHLHEFLTEDDEYTDDDDEDEDDGEYEDDGGRSPNSPSASSSHGFLNPIKRDKKVPLPDRALKADKAVDMQENADGSATQGKKLGNNAKISLRLPRPSFSAPAGMIGVPTKDVDKDKDKDRNLHQQVLMHRHGHSPSRSGQVVNAETISKRRESVQRTASALAKTTDLRLAMESDLSKVQGHLVEWPLDFLRDELESHNFCYPKDYNHPMDLYT
ncbi:Phospholipase D1 [Lunasporangiospora selenospora]|uniref:Phospholipase n=1 Tax=Lunasporangiospora selenospora TaxID=979761 RepID=A0A9P6G4G5_9FUNG|nr:Phospholipase D1 [Lunasporangiospora selenospora]